MKQAFRAAHKTPLFCMWGKVTDTHSEDITADVALETGIQLRHVQVRSMEWSGANEDRGFGERDLPPEGSKVLLLFPRGDIEKAIVLCSTLDTVWEVGEKQKEQFGETGKEREYKKVNEVGWIETYDKDSGDFKLESSSDDTNQIVISIDRSNEKVTVSVGDTNLEVTTTEVNIAGSSKSLVTHAELDAAIQSLVSALNTHIHTGVTTGPGVSGPPGAPVSCDISAAEASKAKTG